MGVLVEWTIIYAHEVGTGSSESIAIVYPTYSSTIQFISVSVYLPAVRSDSQSSSHIWLAILRNSHSVLTVSLVSQPPST